MSYHALVLMHNGNLWTIVDSPCTYDHDQLLSMCHVHLAYLGNGLFMELQGKKLPSTRSATVATKPSAECNFNR